MELIIPPVGKERDILICRLKNIIPCDRWQYYHDNNYIKKCSHKNCVPEFYFPIPFSSDEKQCLELFTEMSSWCKENNYLFSYTVNNYGHSITISAISHKNHNLLSHRKNSFCDSVTEAWIRWNKWKNILNS